MNNEKEIGSTRWSIKSKRLKLIQHCIQLTIAKNENFSKTAVTFLVYDGQTQRLRDPRRLNDKVTNWSFYLNCVRPCISLVTSLTCTGVSTTTWHTHRLSWRHLYSRDERTVKFFSLSPILIRKIWIRSSPDPHIFENHQSDPVLIRQCKTMYFEAK